MSALHSFLKAKAKEMVQKMNHYRTDMNRMNSMIMERTQQLQAATEKYDRMPKDIDRNAYVSRIMDIIKQIHKQKAEIYKVFLHIDHIDELDH